MRFLPYFLFSFLTFEDLGNRALDAGLKSHEAQLLTTPKMIAYMNGVFSMPRNNFEMCCDGICRGVDWRCVEDSEKSGYLNVPWTPSDSVDVVNDLSLLLTSGSHECRQQSQSSESVRQGADRG